MAAALALFAPFAAAQQAADIGTVVPSEYSTLPIAVPAFGTAEGSPAYERPILSEVVANDLRLSGFFHLPPNDQFVTELEALDRTEKKIHYADWNRIGVAYVVKGLYSVQGDQITAEARTYDVTAGTYIFGKRYPNYSADKVRSLAHRISNDIVQRITNWPGIAHTQIAFVRETSMRDGKQLKEIFVMDADGHNLRRLTNDESLNVTPSWGANATELYYTTYKDYNPDLAGIFLDGSYHWYVSRWPGFNLSPDWNSKKRVIALTLSKDGNSEIYLISREGKGPAGRGPKRLTYDRAIDSSPSWSPSGDQIAFTSDRNGSPQIYLMDDSGVNVRRLTRRGTYNDGAAWSPRGDRIAFSSRVDGKFQIVTISPTGEELVQLTKGDYNHEDPSWASNGWVLAYTSDRTGVKQINTMFVDGRPIAQLTQGDRGANSPAWSPMLP